MKMIFFIVSAEYDENKGGRIALHRLCDLINKEGHKAFMWPLERPVWNSENPIRSLYRLIRFWYKRGLKKYKVNEKFRTPIAKYSDLNKAIVVYSETINGNPLKSDKIVRWFLHKPGYFTGEVNYGENELYFFFQTAFNDLSINIHSDNLLQTSYILDDIYINKQPENRSGTCYILRKGSNRTIVHDISDSILIDGLSHTEIANVFNNVEVCISYDLQTMYSSYAAACGCLSIVVPEDGISKDEWRPNWNRGEFGYGIAYGFDDINYAKETQKLVMPMLKDKEKNANQTVRDFLTKCSSFFS